MAISHVNGKVEFLTRYTTKIHESIAKIGAVDYVCAFWFALIVCLNSFMFPWAVESSPLQFLALA